MTVSIIIPLKADQGYLKPCIEACFQQQGVGIEVIVLPDEPLSWKGSLFIEEATGPVSPARKRNRGVQLSKGEILAFIDDDTRPQPQWLQAALNRFNDPKIGAVGGPSITPQDDPYWAQVSGAIYESWMMSGPAKLRYCIGKACDLDDFPSCNLLVRKQAFQEVDGFGTDFWPGEDTEFCLALIKKGYRICYEPRAWIEHHRRPCLMSHFIQLANYGMHRGYFVKRYPKTSFRLPYFLPTLLVLVGATITILAATGHRFFGWLLLILGLLYTLLLIISLAGKPLRLLIASICGIFLSHIVYGLAFLRGLVAQRLPEEK